METSTAALSAREHLELLRAELEQRGWAPAIGGSREKPYLNVVNPDEPGLNGKVAVWGVHYRWTWGTELGSLDDVADVADRIVHVLRGLAP